MNKITRLVFFLFFGIQLNAQTFYATSTVNFPVGNKLFRLDAITCDSMREYSCPPTNNISQYPENHFTDIALDRYQNIYYVSGLGSLYSRNLGDSATCMFLGTFNSAVNALVCDSAATIYAAGNTGGVCTLYKYDGGVFSTLGNFPPGMYSAGDLFFYEHRLFMTATDGTFNTSFLVEVSLSNPQQSCYYMGLPNLQPYGAFSVRSGSGSEVYVLSATSATSSSLVKLDLPGQSIGSVVCTYPFLIGGAATYYGLTSRLTSCITTAAPEEPASWYLTVQNPVMQTLVLRTNIDAAQLNSIKLLDVSGKQVMEFNAALLTQSFDVAEVPAGIYFLQLTTRDKQLITQKLLKAE